MNCVFVYRRIAKTQGGEEGSESRRCSIVYSRTAEASSPLSILSLYPSPPDVVRITIYNPAG